MKHSLNTCTAGIDPTMPNNHNCTVIHYFEGRLCYQVKDQPDAGTGIWCAGKILIFY